MIRSRPNVDTSGTENSIDLRTIYKQIKLGRFSSGVLYYEVQDIQLSSVLIQVLQEQGFQISLVTDTNVKELLPAPHHRPVDQSIVLRIEWTLSVVENLWPTLTFRPIIGSAQQRIKYTLEAVSALATLMFILISFVGLLFFSDRVSSTTLLGCGLGCFLLLCLLVFTDRDE